MELELHDTVQQLREEVESANKLSITVWQTVHHAHCLHQIREVLVLPIVARV